MRLPRWFGALAAALPLAASAVYVNPEGTGQILIYPYYTVQESEGNAFNTYISVVNESTLQAKALRVRFREGRNGREVASFNLLLPPRDAWTAAIAPTPTGTRLLTVDTSCAAPELRTDLQPQIPGYLDFSSAGYTGGNADDYGDAVGRTREGYVEIFEMAAFDSIPSCADFRAFNIPASARRIPSGQLSGTLTLINVESGLDFTVNPVALADAATQHYFRPPDDPYPDYTSSELSRSAAFFVGGKFYRSNWTSPLDAINTALAVLNVENEVVTDRNTRSGTDFVVTFPTKRLAGEGPPFAFRAGDSRDIPFDLYFTSREGEGRSILQACENLCSPDAAILAPQLRFASSVVSLRTSTNPSRIGFGASEVLGSANGLLVNIGTTAESGYVSLVTHRAFMTTQFPFTHSRLDLQTGVLTPSGSARYAGLPSVGFMARTFRNGNLACTGAATCQGNYGGAFPNRGVRNAFP